jgi:hypothetical protein
MVPRNRAASAANAMTSEMCARWSLSETNLERLAPDFEDLALARGPLIQPQEAMMRQRHLSRRWQLAATDQAHIGDGMVGGAERTRGDDSGPPPGEAGDAMDAGGLPRVRQARRRQEGGEAPRQLRRARPRRAEE